MSKTPCADLLPLTIGRVELSEVDPGVITSVAPYRGHLDATSEQLKSAHGMTFPAPNRATGKAGARAIWMGQGQAFVMGPVVDAGLARHAALTDQSDAWAVVRLQGEGTEAVLARLVPVDLRAGQFKRGHTLRSLVMHMPASVTRVGDQAFQIMVFRSMAVTLVHELKTTMEAVAARR